MGLINQIQADILKYTQDTGDFGVPIVLIAPNGFTVTINGLHTLINLGVDTDGNIVNSRKATAAISEYSLVNAGYPVRDNKGSINMISHKVNVADSSGNVKNYMVQQCIPDETIGLITMTLEDFE